MRAAYVCRLRLSRSEMTREVLIVFSWQDTFAADHVDDLIQNEIGENLAPDELLFLVPNTAFDKVLETLETDPISESTLNRLSPKVTVTLVAYGVNSQEERRNHLRGPELEQQTHLKDIFRPAITSIFNKHRGFVESTDSYHFVNPSGRHTNRFLRLSNVLADTAEIAFMAFCCLKFIDEDIKVAYVDTSALFSILAIVNDLRSLFGIQRFHIENFRSYGGIDTVQPVDLGHSMVFISASSSGGMAEKLQSMAHFTNNHLVHFLYLGKSESKFPVVCDLSFHDSLNPEGVKELPSVYESHACEMCRRGSFQVPIRGEHFDIQGPQPQPIILRVGNAPRDLADTVARLRVTDALVVRPASNQYKEFFVDESNLFKDGSQKERLKYFLRRSIPASTAYILQVDNGSKAFAERILEHIEEAGGSAKIIQREEIDGITQNGKGTIVVAAVAIESGRCLADVSRELRSVVDFTPIIYFVGVEKSTEFDQRVALRSTLMQCPFPRQHDFVAVEKIVLPSSNIRNSWSSERELLLDPDVDKLCNGHIASFRDTRLQHLGASQEAIPSDELFWPSNRGNPLKLEQGFVFLRPVASGQPYSQADVFFAIASVLQQLRANSEGATKVGAIHHQWYHQTILDPANFTRYNDDVLQAALLRAALPAELNYLENVEESREIGRIICRIIQAANQARGGAAPEFLLALATKRLSLRKSDLALVVRAAKECDGMVNILGRVLEQVRDKEEME